MHVDTNGNSCRPHGPVRVRKPSDQKFQELRAEKSPGILKSPGIQCALLGLNDFWSDKEDQFRG